MKRLLRLAAALPALLAGPAACATSEASRQLYQWTDASGSVRYTAYPDRVPGDRLHTRRVVEPGGPDLASAPPPRAPRPGAGEPAEVPAPPSALDRRIAELEARIAEDEETLKQLISDPKMADTLRSSPELREIGDRLPALQAELRALREQRASEETGSADDGGASGGGSGDADGS